MKFSILETGKLCPQQPGTVKIIPESSDDMFSLYNNIISKGDNISAVSSRKINYDSASSKRTPSRIKLDLEIKIKAVEYNSSAIRVTGLTVVSNQDVKLGVSHTLELEEKKEFYLTKQKWDEKAIYTLKNPPQKTTVLDAKKAAIEFEIFREVFSKHCGRACIGWENVEAAHHKYSAIETILVTDDLLRSSEFVTRKKYSELVESVKQAGGKALVFPKKHEQLTQMMGITAILRFPLPDLDIDDN